MSVCIGIDPIAGKLAAYDIHSKQTTTITISKIADNDDAKKVDKMYENISSRFANQVNNICVFVLSSDHTCKQFVDRGLSHGFRVQILYPSVLYIYLKTIALLNNKNHKCDLAWIFWDYDCYVWQKEQGKMAFVKVLHKVTNLRSNVLVLKEIRRQAQNNRNPDIIMGGNYGIPFTEKHLKSTYVRDALCGREEVALIHARFMADDPKIRNFAPVTPSSYTIFASDGTIMTENISFSTPTIFVIDFPKKRMKFECEFFPKESGHWGMPFDFEVSHFISMNGGKALVYFVTDINKIYKLKCLDIRIFRDKEIELMADFLISLSPSMKTLRFPQEYVFPSLLEIYDNSINAIGIDFGTSRCCCAVNKKFGIETVAIDNHERQMPSYIAFDEEQPKCGKIVMKRMKVESYAESSIFDFKRIIGRDYDSIKKDINWPFAIEELNVLETNDFENDMVDTICHRNSRIKLLGPQGKPLFKSAEQIAAVILQDIKKKAEAFQGKFLSQVVITVPAAFNNIQTNAIYRAGKSAGFTKVHLLFEPIAAAFAYSVNRPMPENSTILIFDLGGGTLDICIITIKDNKLKIINRSGDPNLGGRDFDNLLVDYFRAKIMSKHDVKWTHGKTHELLSKCQEIKECLSTEEITDFDIDFINPSTDEYLPMTRKAFEEMSKKLLRRISVNIFKAIKKTGLSVKEIDTVLYAGGGCRMPMIKKLLKDLFPNVEHCCDINPDEVVAIGAAHYSYYLNLPRNKQGNGCSVM